MVSAIAPHDSLAPPPTDKLRQQATELEGVFLNTLVQQMFSGIDSKGQFGGGFAEETWRGMQAEQLATNISQAGGIGLADQIMGNMLKIQEASQNQPAPMPQGAYQ
jgi:peptidoglycan hydrolase FlgJ